MNPNNHGDDEIPEDIVPQVLFFLGWFVFKVMIWIVMFLAIADWVASK